MKPAAPSLAAWRAEAGSLEFRGHCLSCRSGGTGPALLLVHGFPTSSFDWARIWPGLAPHFRLHALDMLGFGLSDKPADFDYTIAASADQWEALARANGLEEAVVLAHDYGDTVVQELLARQVEGRLPFRIRAAAFLNGGLFIEATHPLRLQKLLLGPLGPLVARLTRYRSFSASLRRICAQPLDEAELREHWQLLERAGGRRVLPRLIRYIHERRRFRERWVGAMAAAGVPLCHLNGLRDPISGRSIADRWRELLPAHPVVAWPHLGHYPQWEDADAVLSGVLGFLATPASR